MSDAIAVINAGSSSIKFSLFNARDDSLELDLRGQIEGLFTAPMFVARAAGGRVLVEKSWGDGVSLGHEGALDQLIEFLREALGTRRLAGVGHRIVHGGLDFSYPVILNADIVQQLETLVPLAPLHQPHNLAPVRRLLAQRPQLTQVACFDTSFHRSNSDLAQMFGLPHAMFEQGVRRYGFHGLSYEYIASILPTFDMRAANGRTIVAHLGNGASMCAMIGGRSVATSMGFTAVDGLVMGTRTGTLDPGVLLYLMDQRGMDARAIERLIYSESGLLGLSGISSDMRALLASDAPRAKLAIELYCYRIGRELGSLAAAIGGLDAIVFTAGIGENAVAIRAAVCSAAAWLGVELDEDANAQGRPLISSSTSRTAVWIAPTDEELMIARHTQRLLAA